MASGDFIKTAIGIGGMLLMAGAAVVAIVREVRHRKREEATRDLVLSTLTDRFGLAPIETRHVSGHVGSRAVHVELATDCLLIARISVELPALPPDVRIVEFADGPYQKQEELHIGGANPTGHGEFDSAFLVYGSAEQARGLGATLRSFLLAHPVEHLSLSRGEVCRPLPLEPEVAISKLEETLRFCDQLETTAV